MNTLSVPLHTLGVAHGEVVFDERCCDPIQLGLEGGFSQVLTRELLLKLGEQEVVTRGQVWTVGRGVVHQLNLLLGSQESPCQCA